MTLRITGLCKFEIASQHRLTFKNLSKMEFGLQLTCNRKTLLQHV
jgi:hypothetical protein